MKIHTVIFILFIFISSCANSSVDQGQIISSEYETPMKSVNTIQNDTLCFMHLDGVQGQDTTSLQLIIHGKDVHGKCVRIPFEKDSRTGTIKGTRNDDIIKGMWTYVQEGMRDSLKVEFKLNGDKLYQKNSRFDEKTGREMLDETSDFTIEYDRVNCSPQ